MHLQVSVHELMAALQWPVPVGPVKLVLKKELKHEPKNEKILFPVISLLDKKRLVKSIKSFITEYFLIL